MSQMSPLDRRLQELALLNWELFCTYTGVNIQQAQVCLLRSQGRSLGQIAVKLSLKKRAVQRIAERCVPCGGTDKPCE